MTQNNDKNETNNQVVEQPLMSTGTVEAGFDWHNTEKQAAKPKIGSTIVGEKENKEQ